MWTVWKCAAAVLCVIIEVYPNDSNNHESGLLLLVRLLCLDLSPPIPSVLLCCQRCQTLCTRLGTHALQQRQSMGSRKSCMTRPVRTICSWEMSRWKTRQCCHR